MECEVQRRLRKASTRKGKKNEADQQRKGHPNFTLTCWGKNSYPQRENKAPKGDEVGRRGQRKRMPGLSTGRFASAPVV